MKNRLFTPPSDFECENLRRKHARPGAVRPHVLPIEYTNPVEQVK